MKRDSASRLLEEDELRPIEAAKHVASARHSLTCLRDKLGGRHQWPELEEAITKLEIAMSILTTETGGML
jgi:hypothetical protein